MRAVVIFGSSDFHIHPYACDTTGKNVSQTKPLTNAPRTKMYSSDWLLTETVSATNVCHCIN
jgi:hypothetical protein